ncbi:MAG: hypothetical protein H6672_03670 [Anaerolineaceae bacterium]|nr:hypothetical protein [Anaerolineaceae bacterium]
MHKFISVIIIALLFSGLTVSVLAQDGASDYCTTNLDDGSGLPECYTSADNECYAGGVFEAKCDSPWMWNAGWYLARFNQGLISRADFPDFYRGVLPPEPAEENTSVISLIEVCKLGFGNEYCAYSNKTGTRDAGADNSVEEVQLFLPPGTATCPAGYTEANTRPITDWHGGLFTDADLAPLGMDNTWEFCYKPA